eukprot:TRINITY_DN84487_c0_g1_i1.p1 TRINITY_DN84487_c0_g1~~TRINITY_DN84487_c0_g1_i1.p1  ORF type:complete len:290 (+),score=104.37 TRINITY_DN84487_c0_g1_i1:76-945(+)
MVRWLGSLRHLLLGASIKLVSTAASDAVAAEDAAVDAATEDAAGASLIYGREPVSITDGHARLVHKQADKDKDGYITPEELVMHLDQLYGLLRRGDAAADLKEMDSDKDGLLSMGEYIGEAAEAGETEELSGQFLVLDLDEDGMLDHAELFIGMEPRFHPPMVQERVQGMIAELDGGGGDKMDGKLSPKELYNLYDEDGAELPQAEEQKQQFKKLDKNGDGTLDHDELKEQARRDMPLESAVDELFKQAGASSKGLTPDHLVTNSSFQTFYQQTRLADMNMKPFHDDEL